MESDPDFLGPAALAKAQRFVGDQRDDDDAARAAEGPLRRARHLGLHALLLLQPALPQGRRSARRDRQARRARFRFGSGRVRREDEHVRAGRDGRRARRRARQVFVDSTHRGGFLNETELVPKTIGPLAAALDVPFALRLARAGKVPNPLRPHKAKNNDEVKRLWKLLEAQAREHEGLGTDHPSLIDSHDVRPSACRSATRTTPAASPASRRRSSTPRPAPSARKLGVELVEHGVDDVLRRRRHPRGEARLLPAPERAHPGPGRGARHRDTILTICNVCTLNLRQANKKLQQDAGRARARQRATSPRSARATYSGGVDVRHLLWEVSRGRRLRALQGDRGALARRGSRWRRSTAARSCGPSQAARLRGPRPPAVARAPDRGLRRRGDRLPGQGQVLRLPDRAGARGRGARRGRPAAAAGQRRRAPT